MQLQIALLELRFKDHDTGVISPVRLTSAPFDVEHSGVTWFAAGDLLDIGGSESTYELITDTVEINLSGVNSAYRVILDRQGFRNAPIDILLATLPENSKVVSSAKYYHRGYACDPVTEYDESTDTIALRFESESVFKKLDKNSMLMTCSMAHHQALHPNDKFFQYAADSSMGEEVWKD